MNVLLYVIISSVESSANTMFSNAPEQLYKGRRGDQLDMLSFKNDEKKSTLTLLRLVHENTSTSGIMVLHQILYPSKIFRWFLVMTVGVERAKMRLFH